MPRLKFIPMQDWNEDMHKIAQYIYINGYDEHYDEIPYTFIILQESANILHETIMFIDTTYMAQ